MAKTTKKVSKKNTVRVDSEGQAHIQATFNNIIISLTNNGGQVISWILSLLF
jgi:small subunit ribosomal protein S11